MDFSDLGYFYIAFILAAIIVLVIVLVTEKKHPNKKGTSAPPVQPPLNPPLYPPVGYQTVDITNNYQPKWLFSTNEKYAYRALSQIVSKYGYTVFAKVRLLDLITPQKKTSKSDLYRIQAKHVDFVICDEKLVAKYIIELDDNSHNAPDRIQRDLFVDAVLTKTGYKVLHTRAIDENQILSFMGIMPQ